jgi:hypothetical protein
MPILFLGSVTGRFPVNTLDSSFTALFTGDLGLFETQEPLLSKPLDNLTLRSWTETQSLALTTLTSGCLSNSPS